MKETLLMGSMGMIFFLVMGEWKKAVIAKGLLLSTLLVFVWILKYYIAVLFFPILLMILIGKEWKRGRLSLKQYRLSWMLVPVVLFSLSFLHPNLHLDKVYDIMIDNHAEVIEMTGGEHVISIETQNIAEVAKSIPEIYFLGWYGPIFNFEAPDLMIAGLEGLGFLLLSLVFIIRFRKPLYREYEWIILPLLLYILAATFFVTLSTPAYGNPGPLPGCIYRVSGFYYFASSTMDEISEAKDFI